MMSTHIFAVSVLVFALLLTTGSATRGKFHNLLEALSIVTDRVVIIADETYHTCV